MLPQHSPVQIAYFVNDIKESARRMGSLTGAGPFYIIENIELEWSEHRRSSCDFVHSSAYGQWGNVMVELVQQESEGPSPFRDMYAPGEEGIHHVACFVDSVEDSIRLYEERGYPLATRAKAKLGTEFAFIDTRKLLGHMVEIYVENDAMSGFYNLVKEASVGWDGSNILRSL
jgi:Glyoxalase/Bleomycin resistance protein/Dioxygenase superfamily